MAGRNVQDGLRPNHDNEEPNHIILWLDATIGNLAEYKHLRRAFGSNTDPRVKKPTPLTGRDYDNLIMFNQPQYVRFEGVQFLLQAFDNKERCLEAFETHQNKRIFFITSGQLGKEVVPGILERYTRIFTDLITNKPYPSIYVFCHSIEWNLEWAMDHLDYIQMFNFDSELLERMVRDIAEYFIQRAERMLADNNLKNALQRLHWAKRLWLEYDRMQQQIPADQHARVRESERMTQINGLISTIDSDPSYNMDTEPYMNISGDEDERVGESVD